MDRNLAGSGARLSRVAWCLLSRHRIRFRLCGLGKAWINFNWPEPHSWPDSMKHLDSFDSIFTMNGFSILVCLDYFESLAIAAIDNCHLSFSIAGWSAQSTHGRIDDVDKPHSTCHPNRANSSWVAVRRCVWYASVHLPYVRFVSILVWAEAANVWMRFNCVIDVKVTQRMHLTQSHRLLIGSDKEHGFCALSLIKRLIKSVVTSIRRPKSSRGHSGAVHLRDKWAIETVTIAASKKVKIYCLFACCRIEWLRYIRCEDPSKMHYAQTLKNLW